MSVLSEDDKNKIRACLMTVVSYEGGSLMKLAVPERVVMFNISNTFHTSNTFNYRTFLFGLLDSCNIADPKIHVFLNIDFLDEPYIVSYSELHLPNSFKSIYNDDITMLNKLFEKIPSDNYTIFSYKNITFYLTNIFKICENQYLLIDLHKIVKERSKIFDNMIAKGIQIDHIRKIEKYDYLRLPFSSSV